MKHSLPILLAVAALVSGCVPEPTQPAEAQPADDLAWMQAHADDYLGDRAWRRDQLEAMLWRDELPYARKLLAGYALERGGWDLLAPLEATVAPVTADAATTADADSFQGRSLLPAETPQTREEWIALGREVFWSMPMRSDAYLEWLAARPELWDEVGLQTDADGAVRGMVRYRNPRGQVRTAATCGMCHGDQGIAGRAARQLDLGRARTLFAQARGIADTDYDAWPAGTVDITDDGVTDPLAVPDLWGVSHQSHINSAGSIALTTPAALAVRFETQYILGHAMEGRPDRRLTWALAMYVLSLEPESARTDDAAGAGLADAPAEVVGRADFEERCAECHRPDQGFSGDLVDANLMVSDPQAAYSRLRGTGYYRVPSLRGLSADGGAAPYLHDASQPSLRALLASGHPFGTRLDDATTDRLLIYLNTL